ncbi:MAG: ribbon-helix-helix protein, CopG family [Cyanobacteria bacterium SZAS TMP-1]|nr:ribbon-helix-helix protein, CopG family [Cyanobacteria bacterium SZAS TMP-1]
MPKINKVLVTIPPAMLTQVDAVAKLEHRTRSDLIREALRRYIAAARLLEAQQAPARTTEVS